ncbi:indole-3-glycerol phosphate synthase TrpC [Phycisphaera mikurensis]|uniref:Indole-3-glycerol phosphate synthase n=1 Tax=Phycisphaera mikurensis (strain NBRC 102666 / KCTC 22515 / FYK2301M01) TaxID=1142394 RepID=I0IEQ5_PHYMF|nr:indole-3-glycerol phosphate synthase TrpC [Phycisphaera mikurensis]MBB6441539.1 indole-3-glycerol phosphate synthase [Phycisphaera mikurensis]BAM03743.1 putative indole-3-glycerol phosphate synthase [Phycisphaera mikurensis NBRC 102666]
MPSILDDIVQTKRAEVDQRSASVSLEEMKARALDTPRPRNFFKALTQPARRLKVIAEVKRASPSAGVLRDDFDAVQIAEAYHANGAAAISCLTDERYFQGRLEDLQRIKDAVPIPVLRKDFLIDPWQLYESRAAGADAVLLIAECLREPEMIDLLILATELQMTTLVEVHDLESLIQVKPHLGFPLPGYQLLGINNRDLREMTTDVAHTIDLLGEVPDKGILVSESGIREHADVAELLKNGVYRVLVGESLMKQEDPGAALRELIHGDDGGESFNG